MQSARRRLTLTVSALAFAAVIPTVTPAAVYVWNGGTDLYSNPLAWSPLGTPGAGDDAQILAAGSVAEVAGVNAAAGTLELGSGNQLQITNSNFSINQNAITNDGTISIAAGSRFTSGSGNVTVGGTGIVALDDTINYSQLYGGGFIFGAGQTVRGSGQIGVNQGVFTNNGLFSADVNNRTLDIDPTGGNGGTGGGFGTGNNAGFYNTATMQATNGGTLALEGGLYENSATGVIQALNGSTVSLNSDSRVVNGVLTTVGTGVISAFGTTQYLQSVTLSTASKLAVNNDNLFVNTGMTVNGSLTVSSGSRLISETGVVNYTGSGTITLDNSANYAQLYGGSITFGSGLTVQGSGQLGINQALITNNGLISADVGAGGGIDVDATGNNAGVAAGTGLGTSGVASLLNNGIMQATDGSNLQFESGYYDNTSGVIRAINGSKVSLASDARIVGGTLTADATSQISAINTNQYLQSVTLSSGSKLNVTNDNLYINTGITNNGTITLSGGSRLESETGSVTYGGTGTIVLDNSGNYVQVYGGAITFGAGQTVRGSGSLGINQALITNNGLISADVGAGGGIDVDALGNNAGVAAGTGLGTSGVASLLNNSIMQATGGSNLQFESGYYDNTPGVIQAINGSLVSLAGDSRIVGGTLIADATSQISAINTNQYLQSVTLSSGSKLNVTNDNLYINTGITNNGTITVSGGSRLLSETGSVTYGGTGTIVLDNSGNFVQVYGGAITFGAGQTVRGSGQLGINQALITNNGLISAGPGTGIDVDAAGNNAGVAAGTGLGTSGVASLLNNSIMQATGGSNLQFESGYYDNTPGVIQAINGSLVSLAGDSRIVGGTLTADATSQVSAINTNQYLQSVTLSSGSKLNVTNDNLYINTGITNNGTITVSGGSRLLSETGSVTYGGTGTIVLDNSGNFVQVYGGSITFGAGQTVRGSGQLGVNQAVFTNNGLISGDVSGGNIDIDPSGGNGGLGGGGVGTGGNAAFYNTGTVQSANSGTTTLEGGLYENSATGTFAALTGSTTNMTNDSSLYNLQAGGVLDLGNYTSATTGAASVLNLQSNAANSIVTIGTGAAGTDTVVTLSGANSQINAYTFNQGALTSIDSSLTTVANSGELVIENGRSFTATANGGAFSNAGIVKLAAGTFGATTYANSGLTTGSGTVAVDIANTGTVESNGGTLATQAIIGFSGVIRTVAGSTLSLSAASAAGTLTNNGALVLGTNNVTVNTDYNNANFGSGNAFNRRANVSGSGDIYGVSYTVDLSGPAVSGGTIDVGNVRTGGSSSTTLTITNNGAATNIVGAVQNTNAPDIVVSNPDFTAAYGGGSATTMLSYTGTHAGSLAGETITVVNNFANVAPQTLAVQGNVYQIAIAGSQPTSVTLGASRVGGTAQSSALTIANVAPNTNGYTEALTSTASTNSPFLVDGGASATASNIAAGGTTPIIVSLGTGTAGAFNNTVAISNTSIPVAGSGFSNLALAGQSVAVSGNVYAPAVANLSSTTVAFGPVRQGSTSPMQSLTLTNGSVGSLSDSLLTTAGTQPTGVTVTTPGSLAQSQQGAVVFALSTANAGQLSGTGSLNFASHDSQLSDLALPSQTVNFTGTVTQLAQALVTKNSGVGVLAGSGNTYTLNLGSFASGSGLESSILGVTNNIPNSTFAEFLNGAFTASPAQGFSFSGQSFTGLAGGSNAGGDLLSFNTTGASAGAYTDVLTFNGYSSYPGLSNDTLGPVTVDVSVQVTGGVAGVPEPAAWAMMLVGFGLIGGTIRRRRTATAMRAVAA